MVTVVVVVFVDGFVVEITVLFGLGVELSTASVDVDDTDTVLLMDGLCVDTSVDVLGTETETCIMKQNI